MRILKYLSVLTSVFIINFSYGQTLTWNYIETGVTNGNCTSATNCGSNSLCFALEYLPTVSGTATSYTLGFTGSCVFGSVPNIVTTSCTMTNNTTIINGCAAASLYLLQASGNNGNTPITAGVPIVLHQVCLDLGVNGVSNIMEEETTGLSVSIDSAGTGDPITEILSFAGFIATTDFCEQTCLDTMLCSLDFGKQVKLTFDTLVGGNIAESTSAMNSGPISQSFDLYDEINKKCQDTGGDPDVTFTFQTINTTDLNNLGIIDALAGNEQHIVQTSGGLVGNLPFGTSMDSETSTGDSRGYSITVEFASHLEIVADQITVALSGMNTAGTAFETAKLSFLDEFMNPFGTSTHLGLFNDTTDLSGNCMPTQKILPWNVTGFGTVVFQDTATINLADPCNPAVGSATTDTVYVNAQTDASLDPATVIGGFILTVIGEDVAAPPVLDDGTGGDDSILANANTNTITSLQSSLLGYTINGCVFPDPVLAADLKYFKVYKVGNHSLLEWTLENLLNTDYISIEWSADGKHFHELDRQYVLQGESENKNASFIHRDPSVGKNYYRLKEVSLDGGSYFSEIKSLLFEGNDLSKVKLFPNPSHDKIRILLPKPADDDLSIIIYSIQGIVQRQYMLKNGESTMLLELGGLEKGQYFLKIGTTVKRFVKIN